MRETTRRISTVLRDRYAQFLNRAEADGPVNESGVISQVLSTPVRPPGEFVASLEDRLMAAPASAGTFTGSSERRLRPRLLRAAAPLGILIAVLAAVMFISMRGGETAPPLHADVIRDSALKLYDLETVRYHVSVEADQGVCFTVTEHVPVEVIDDRTFYKWKERQPIPPEDRSTYGCLGSFSQKHVEERGVYDVATGSFSAESRSTGKAVFPVTPEERDRYQSERIYVNRELYARQAGGTWNRIPTLSVWHPFSFENDADGQIPIAEVDQLFGSYDNMEILGTEQLNGVDVIHYRGSRNMIAGEETINAWIGAEDGLPHRATIVMKALAHEQPLYWRYPGEQRSWDGPLMNWDFSPEDGWVMVMGDLLVEAPEPIPAAPEGHTLYSYEYEFSDFNEPVEIAPPLMPLR